MEIVVNPEVEEAAMKRNKICRSQLVIFGVALLVSSVLVVRAQSTREHLLQSEGNLKVSKLFNETPVLPTDDLEAELYRMTFIPTFFGPVKIRVERHREEYVLVAKRLSGQGGFEVGKLKDEKRRRLKSEEWNRLQALINKAGFWEMPYAEKPSEPTEKGELTICLDGSEWVLEGVKKGRFHVVTRYCPDEKTFEEIGLYLAKLSGLKIKQRELY